MKYLWVDMEMSGLDVGSCRILEVAAIITDQKFQPLEEYHQVVKQPEAVLKAMDAWCTKAHGESGLTAAVLASPKDEAAVEAEVIALLDRHFPAEERILLCGNSIGQDRKFIDRYWTKLASRLHYRMVDVTSFKEIFRRNYGIEYAKRGTHRALDDIRESIAELEHYLGFVDITRGAKT